MSITQTETAHPIHCSNILLLLGWRGPLIHDLEYSYLISVVLTNRLRSAIMPDINNVIMP